MKRRVRKVSLRTHIRRQTYTFLLLGVTVIGGWALYDANRDVWETPKPIILTQVRPVAVELYLEETDYIFPAQFVSNLNSEEYVKISYLADEPNFDQLGKKVVAILLEDREGNQQVVLSHLSVRRTDPTPLLEGVQDIEVFVGDAIAYRSGVSSSDLYGETLDLQIDNTQVDVKVEGVYPVLYRVEDAYGNSNEQEAFVYVDENTQLLVETYIDEIFATILTEGMTDHEKAYAIFRWCRDNIRYASSGHMEDYYAIAYGGLRGLPGDCYTYYAVSYFMLQRADIPVMTMQRVEGTGVDHMWVIVNTGSGWYHFDTCPTFTKDEVFMYSESKIRDVDRRTNNILGQTYQYYDYRPLPEGITIEEN